MDPVLMRRLAKPLLFLAAFIWGTSFFIMKNTLDSVPVLWLLTFRFTTGAVLVGLLCGRKWRTRFTPDYVWRGAVLGSLLFAAYAVQTFGLVGTTPSKNAFLTATYCVLVPFLHWAVSRQRPDRFHLLAAFLCITGVGLVSLNGSLTITWGDLLSLGSALFYALHIVAVNKLSDRRDIYLLTSLQFAFTALLAVIGGLEIYLFGAIAAQGIAIMIDHKVDMFSSKNIAVIASIMVIGIGGNYAFGGNIPFFGIQVPCIAGAAIFGILLNLLLSIGEKKEKAAK